MSRIILGILILITNINLSFAQQAVFEHSYTTAFFDGVGLTDESFFAFHTQNGINYYTFDKVNRTITIYNQNHTFVRTVHLPTEANGNAPWKMYFITDKLFNDDDKIEMLYSTGAILRLINEDGILLQSFPGRVYARLIKDQENNWKLIVSNTNYALVIGGYNQFDYDVYALSGALSTAQEEMYMKNPSGYPNPAENSINIPNQLPNGKQAVLEVFDGGGKKVFEKNVTGGNNYISIDVTGLQSGTYIYKLDGQTNRFIKK